MRRRKCGVTRRGERQPTSGVVSSAYARRRLAETRVFLSARRVENRGGDRVTADRGVASEIGIRPMEMTPAKSPKEYLRLIFIAFRASASALAGDPNRDLRRDLGLAHEFPFATSICYFFVNIRNILKLYTPAILNCR